MKPRDLVVVVLGAVLVFAAPASAQYPNCVPVVNGRLSINTYRGSYGGGVAAVGRGTFTVPFPFSPALDPPSTGIRFRIFDANDVQVGGGIVSYWRPPVTTSKGTRWTSAYYTATTIATATNTPGLIKFKTKGSTVQPSTFVLPLRFELILSSAEPPAAGAQCAEATFPGPSPLPSCRMNVTQTGVSCR